MIKAESVTLISYSTVKVPTLTLYTLAITETFWNQVILDHHIIAPHPYPNIKCALFLSMGVVLVR